MYKFNLQRFAEAVPGKKIVYLYRIQEEAATTTGTTIAFVTENNRTKSKDADSTATKDGSIRTPSEGEVEITCTSIMMKGDTMISKLEDALDNDKLIEIWEANLEDPGTESNKYKGRYFQGYLTELEISSNAEDNAEVSMTFGVNGSGKTGDVTVTADQIAQAEYVFTDTTTTGA